MNWFVLVITGVILVTLVIFTIRKNSRDRSTLEKKLNKDYDRPEKHSSSADPEDLKGD